MSFKLEDVFCYEAVKDDLRIVVDNYEKHHKCLKNSLYEQRMDLVLSYCLYKENDEDGVMIIRINDDLMRKWGATKEEVVRQARMNMQRPENGVLMKMENKMDELISLFPILTEEEKSCISEVVTLPVSLYVLGNASGYRGSGAMFFSDAISRLSDVLGKDIYILPSSIHELILMPDCGSHTEEELEKMVYTVNRECLSDEEFLSDHVYLYTRKDGQITMV